MALRSALPPTLFALFVCFLLFGSMGEPSAGIAVARRTLAQAGTADMGYFVEVLNGRFVVNCKPFYISGGNQWEMVEAAAGGLELFGASLPPNTTGPALIRGLFDRAVANGFNVVRGWAHTVTAQYALETSPGEYNEAIFRGLDYALDEARKRGIRMLLSLTDNWQATGGADEMVRWAGSGDHESFFTSPRTKQLYKERVVAVLQRVNSVSGIRYRDDPTIFAWNLINEPRCYKCGRALAAWVSEMAQYVKSLDPNHLLTVGEEGFYAAGQPQSSANPQGNGYAPGRSWAEDEGQDFLADHASPYIDFMAIHLWVNNWEDKRPAFVSKWIAQHIADAQAAGKPLLMEEFGVWGGNRTEQDQYYRLVLDAIQQNAQAGGPAQGALFWTQYAKGQRAPAEEGGSAGGLYGVFEGEGPWPIIQGFAQAMGALSGGPAAAGCSGARRTTAAPPPACPSGYEGAGCELDINECARGISGCDPNAACSNTKGGFSCTCYQGYAGDGVSCSPTAQLAAIQAQYETDGPAQLACSEGQGLVYPEGQPGFAYDVTGALARVRNGGQQGGLGSRSPVAPVSCMIACNAAPGCDSFAYNAQQQKCFLKTGATRRTCEAPETVCVSARGKPYSCGTWQTYFKKGAVGQAAAATDGGSRAAGAGGSGGAAGSATRRSQPGPQAVQAFNQQP